MKLISNLTVLLYACAYLVWRLLLISPLYAQYWQIQITEVFGSWFYLPLLPLLFLSLCTRGWRPLYILMLPTAFFVWEYGAQFAPNWQRKLASPVYAQGELHQLRVLTWNSHLSYNASGEFFELLETIQPDVVTLQEVSSRMKARAAAELMQEYPYQHFQRHGWLLTLSRYPLSEPEVQELNRLGCRCLPLQVQKETRTFIVVNTHVPRPTVQYRLRSGVPSITHFDPSEQQRYFEVLFTVLEELEGPLLLQGDLNTTERQPYFRQLTDRFRDSFAEAGWGMGYTYPKTQAWHPFWLLPLIRIDHILHSPEFVTTAAWTGSIKESDHLYVVAELYWP